MQTCQVPLMQLVACDKNVHIYVDGKSGCVACIYEQLNIRNLYGTVFHVMPIFFVPHAHIHNKFNLFIKVARKSKLVSLTAEAETIIYDCGLLLLADLI